MLHRPHPDCCWSSPLIRLRMPHFVLCFWAGLLGQPSGNAYNEHFDFYWYNKELQRLVKVHQCELLSLSQKKYPFYGLQTDEVFVAWCSVLSEPYRLFHLIVLTRTSTHPWAGCPKFIRFDDVTDPTYLWMERPTQIRGTTLSLDNLIYHDEDPTKPPRPGPKDVKATGPSLWTGNEDASWFLYCYKGTWMDGGEGA